MPGIASSNFVTTATRERFFPKSVDNVFEGNILFNRLRSTARPWSGGHRGTITLTVSDRNQGGSFSGFDTLSTTQEDVRQRSTFDPSEYYWPVVFSGIQLAVNKGPEAFLNLVGEEFSDTARALSEKLGEDMYLDKPSGTVEEKFTLIGEILKLVIPDKHLSLAHLETI